MRGLGGQGTRQAAARSSFGEQPPSRRIRSCGHWVRRTRLWWGQLSPALTLLAHTWKPPVVERSFATLVVGANVNPVLTFASELPDVRAPTVTVRIVFALVQCRSPRIGTSSTRRHLR